MDIVAEPLNGGLVTARHPGILQPGELAEAANVYYRPDDPALHKVRGRTIYNSTPVTGSPNIKGLRVLAFDDAKSILVAHVSAEYYYSVFSDESGSFASLVTGVGTGTGLDAIHHNNKHYLLNGVGRNRVVKADLSVRNHGLFPISNFPQSKITTGSSTNAWPPTLGTGYYFFLVTEVVNPNTPDEVESTFISTPRYANVSTVNTNVVITRHDVVNSEATHWRVYMWGPQTDGYSPPPPLNLFRRVAETDIDQTSITLGGQGTLYGPNLPTVGTDIAAGWSNIDNVKSSTDSGADATSSTEGATAEYDAFGFALPSATITGIEVRVAARINNYIPGQTRPILKVQLTDDNTGSPTWYPQFGPGVYGAQLGLPGSVGVTGGGWEFIPTAGSTPYAVFTFGGRYNKWGKSSWSNTEVNSANFAVRLISSFAAVAGTQSDDGNSTLSVDYIQVLIHTSGTDGSAVNLDGVPFRTIAISVGGVTAVLGADGNPPVASTGDIFEDQMVTNDMSDRSIIRYSLPGRVDAFPELYFVNFETKETDEVTCIRRAQNKLLVGLRTQLYRMNYLPRETDSEFDRGRCYEVLSESFGITGPHAAASFSPDGGAQLLAFLSHAGLLVTDGFEVRPATSGIDWTALLKYPSSGDATNYLEYAVLTDYPNESLLVLDYIPASAANGTTTPSAALYLHYHSSHRDQGGKLKVTGPVTVSALSRCRGQLGGRLVMLTGQASGTVFVEDRGYLSDGASGVIAPSIKTRDIYPWGPGASGRVSRMWALIEQDATATLTVTIHSRKGNAALLSRGSKTFQNAQRGLARLDYNFDGEMFRATIAESSNDQTFRLASLHFLQQAYGAEDK